MSISEPNAKDFLRTILQNAVRHDSDCAVDFYKKKSGEQVFYIWFHREIFDLKVTIKTDITDLLPHYGVSFSIKQAIDILEQAHFTKIEMLH